MDETYLANIAIPKLDILPETVIQPSTHRLFTWFLFLRHHQIQVLELWMCYPGTPSVFY